MTPQPPGDDEEARLAPLPPKILVGWALAGLVLGWLMPYAISAVGGDPPRVAWLQAAVLYFVAALLLSVARATRVALDTPGRRPESHQLVNRLVLARACGLVGALVTGGYVGYAVSWWGVSTRVLGGPIMNSLIAALGGLLMAVAAGILERACRVPPEGDLPG